MKQAKAGGMTVRPIIDMRGGHHFNEVSIEDLLLPEEVLLGREGDGWKQVTGELAFERSALIASSLPSPCLWRRCAPWAPRHRNGRRLRSGGHLHLLTLRRLSRSIAGMLQAGEDPALQASLVKDLGNVLEQETVEVVRLLVDVEPSEETGNTPLTAVLAHLIMTSPSFSLRGDTWEICGV